jgi:outer membrane protein
MRLLILFYLITLTALAQTDFNSLWQDIKDNSHQIKSYEQELKLKELEKERAQRHWLPKLNLGYSNFQTNDPGGVFFNNLGQGAIENSDFSPANLNNPDTEQFSFTKVQIILPLYEGSMKHNKDKMQNKLYEAQKYQLVADLNTEYTQALNDYVSIDRIKSTQIELNKIEKQLKRVIKNYTFGSKNNPLGRSGLLGLKGVQQRLIVTNSNLTSDVKHRLRILSFKANKDINNTKKINDIVAYLNNLLQSKSETKSTRLKANEMKLEAFKLAPDMETARFLPQVNLFAEQNIYQGDRDDNQTQTIGIALRWSLFDSDNYGRKSEALQRVRAQSQKLKHARLQERAYKESLKNTKENLEQSLKNTYENSDLLAEQATLTFNLYRRGKVNALQLAEILNRKIDLEINKLQLENMYLQTVLKNYEINN